MSRKRSDEDEGGGGFFGGPKFPHEKVEELKVQARIEETFPDADRCPDCALRRRETGDPTYLCDRHLERIYGVRPARDPR